MKSNLYKITRSGFVSVASLAFAAFVVACSGSDDKSVAGGTSDDAGIVAVKDLNVAGTAQKGPFVKGSAVTVQGIDCKTMELKDELYEGAVKSDKGDFAVDSVTLSASCALFEVTGQYRDELTGKKSAGEITLHALTNLKDRKTVNVNLFTHLEYERVVYLVTVAGKIFAEAKSQAEKEVLATFGIKEAFEEFENLNLFESGDGNAALLAVSVMMQGGVDVAGFVKRLSKFEDSFAESGEWNDAETRTSIAEWVEAAVASGELDSIRKNVVDWGYAGEVPAFEKYVETFVDSAAVSSSSAKIPTSDEPVESSSAEESSSSAVVPENVEESSDGKDVQLSEMSSSSEGIRVVEGSLTDSRDGQVYRTLEINGQVWMAENLNYKTDDSRCYHDSLENCAKYGRLYVWAEALNVCPEGWYLPDTTEWYTLLYGTIGDIAEVGIEELGRNIRSKNGWLNQGTGGIDATDALGFSVLPGGSGDSSSYVGKGYNANFWTALSYSNRESYSVYISYNNAVAFSIDDKGFFESVRCLKGKPVGASSSSISAVSSSSEAIPISVLCKTEVVDACEYGTLTDDRDGQTYKTVKIGEQWWMAENLNYNFSADSLGIGSYCYNDSAKYCEKYGALYTWAVAMDSVGLWSDDAKGCGYEAECSPKQPVQGICPNGWHLPDNDEWKVLFEIVGGDSTAGNNLKAYDGVWARFQGAGVVETDIVGFSALPAGRKRGLYSEFDAVGLSAYFWSATQDEESQNHTFAYHMELNSDKTSARLTTFNSAKDESYSVRCVKD